MNWLLTPAGTAVLCAAVWLISYVVLPKLEQVNLVQRINFGTINAVFVLLFLHLVLP